jgi:lipopolysaccharide transport system ATP-binding protein
MGTVRDLCNRAIYLRRGVPVYVGDTASAVRHYFKEGAAPISAAVATVVTNTDSKPTFNLDVAGKNASWSRTPVATDRLIAVSICDEHDRDVDHASMGSDIFLKVYYRSLIGDTGTVVALAVKNRYDQIVFVTNSYRLGVENCDAQAASYAVFTFKLSLTLEAGLYSLKAGISQPTGCNRGQELDTTGWWGPFSVKWDYEIEVAPFLGMFGLPASGHLVLAN